MLFLLLPFILYRELGQRYATACTGDRVVLGLYLFGVATCFALSVTFHTLMSHSAQGFAFGVQLDFQGIILLMWSATAPMVYNTFYTEPTLQKVYWSLVGACHSEPFMPFAYSCSDLHLCGDGEHNHIYSCLSQSRNEASTGNRLRFSGAIDIDMRHPWVDRAWVECSVIQVPNVGSRTDADVQHNRRNCLRPQVP